MERIFKKNIKIQYKNSKCDVLLCYDSDVFEYAAKPPVDWEIVKKALKEGGASSVGSLIAVKSIEDWFLLDKVGIKRFLKLPEKTRLGKYTGTKGLAEIFKKAGKTYIKGNKCQNFVEALDIGMILDKVDKNIAPLYEAMDFDMSA